MTRIGIIGTGWGARAQAPAFRSAGLSVTLIAGRDPKKTRLAAKDNDIPQWVTDWRDLVSSGEVDIVSIISPPVEHCEMAVAALDHDKHVLCEKPMAMNAEEATRMVEESRKHPDRLALIDHELRFLPSFREARRRREEIGSVWHAEVRYSSPSRGNPAREWNWWSDQGSGGGILGAVGSHMVDALRFLVGEIQAARGTLRTFVEKRPFEGHLRDVTSDDYASVDLRFSDGAFATIGLSVVAGVDEPTTITIHGQKGSMRLMDERLWMASRSGGWELIVAGDGRPGAGDSPGGYFGTGTRYLGRAIAAALDGNDSSALSPAADFEDGLAVQRVLDAVRRSSKDEGSWEDVGSNQRATNSGAGLSS